MQCGRCQGRMVADYFIDLNETGELWMPGWRCLICGEIVDPIIASNREAQKKAIDSVANQQPTEINTEPIAPIKN